MSSDKESSVSVVPQRRRLSCSTYFDALWFCYSPVYQMQQYYRQGVLDNCSAKWSALFDCLTLKTKSSSQVQEFPTIASIFFGFYITYVQEYLQMISSPNDIDIKEILETREKAKPPHIWTFRTREEAASHWQKLFGPQDDME